MISSHPKGCTFALVSGRVLISYPELNLMSMKRETSCLAIISIIAILSLNRKNKKRKNVKEEKGISNAAENFAGNKK